MRIKLNITKTVQENAAIYYQESKEAREKIIRVEKAIEETKKEIERAKKELRREQAKKTSETKTRRKKEWYEKFHYFFTSFGKLVIGGRNAEQNDLIYKMYLENKDLFFHADIQGGSVCVLKEGVETNEDEMKEVAQFSACFSNAWKNGNAIVDVYGVKKEQVSKHAVGGFIGKGAFAINGERIWFRNTELKLKIGTENEKLMVLPACCKRKLEKEIVLIPGNEEKGNVVKKLVKMLKVHPDEIQNMLPAGRSNIINFIVPNYNISK